MLELGLALTGVMIVLTAIGNYFTTWLRLQQQPADWTPVLTRIALGLGVILIGWLWSFCTGLVLLRRARNAPPLSA